MERELTNDQEHVQAELHKRTLKFKVVPDKDYEQYWA